MLAGSHGFGRWLLLSSLVGRLSASSISAHDSQKQKRVATVDSQGTATLRALMRQDQGHAENEETTPDAPVDGLWARFFGASGSSVANMVGESTDSSGNVTGTSENATGTGTSGNATGTLGSATNTLVKTLGPNTRETNVTSPSSASKLANVTLDVLVKLNSSNASEITVSDKACEDTWEPEWSTQIPAENCEEWARDNGWGALASASSLREACKGEWAQKNCMATCGCEAVTSMQLDKAIHEAAVHLGYTPQQDSELQDLLDGMSLSAKTALMHVLAHSVSLQNATATSTPPATTTSTSKPPVPIHAILDVMSQLGFDQWHLAQLNETLQLIHPDHYEDIIAVLKLIFRSSSTTPAASPEEILEAAAQVGLKKKDILAMNATLDDIKPDLHDEVLSTVKEVSDMVDSIGVERTGKAVVRHLRNLSRPDRELLPKVEEPNEFVVQVATLESRQEYRDRQGEEARGFHFKVSLPVEEVVSFIESRTHVRIEDPRSLSLVIARVEFTWPSHSCSNEESGFTDYRLLDFHSGEVTNEGSECGALAASSVDRKGEVRLPESGQKDLFWLAGMFGTKYSNSTGGAEVAVKIAQLVFHEFRDNGDVIEYGMCGRGSFTWKDQHFYIGCPKKIPLQIHHPDECLGRAVKLCHGNVLSEDPVVQSRCFDT